jgi:hypothetical protein
MNKRRRILLAFALITLFLGLAAYGTYSELQASTEPAHDPEIAVPAAGVDQSLARKIALQIGKAYGNDGQAVIESLSQSPLGNLDQAENLVGSPSDQVWQVVLSGKFSIREGSMLVKAIHASKMYVLIRARDGQVLAVGTLGPSTVEMDQTRLPAK